MIDSLAIGEDREAYAFAGDAVYSLDLDTGVLTEVASNPSHTFYSFAHDPVTGEFYALSQNGDLFLFNRTALTIDPVGTLPHELSFAYGLQFDSTGRLWYVDTAGFGFSTVLTSATLGDLANPVASGPLTTAGDATFFAFSLAIVHTPVVPQLAATGSTSAALCIGLGGAAILLLGVGALAARRRLA